MIAAGRYQKWLLKENLTLLEGWARSGLSNEQIAHNIGITAKTLYEWKNKYSEISNAIKKGKEVADFEVENALFKNAIGMVKRVKKPIKLKKEVQQQGVGKVIEERIEYIEEEIYIPPQTVAQIFWLKNRMPKKWKDKIDQSHSIEIEDLTPLVELLNEEN